MRSVRWRDQVRRRALDVQVKRKTGLGFYNTSRVRLQASLEDPEGLRANLMDYITGFSANIDVFERFKFENELATLDEKNRLYLVTSSSPRSTCTPTSSPTLRWATCSST